MLSTTELLAPITGSNPGGVELRYDPLYGKIKEARREDVDAPQGDWQTERKTADWALVVKLASEAIASKSKDLQLSAWLAEALLKREGFAGLQSGLELITGLLDQFWDQLYPEIDDGDLEMRAAPLEWVGGSAQLITAVRLVPVTRDGYDLFQYQESRGIPTEQEAADESAKGEVRTAKLAEGKISPEEIDRAFASTPKVWYKTLVGQAAGALEALSGLDERAKERFGSDAPNFAKLRSAIDEVTRFAKQLLQRKLELDPDPVEAAPVVAEEAPVSGSASNGAGAVAAAAGAPLTSRDAAAAQIVAAARFLRQSEPTNPAAYLLLRGFRWGELRAGDGHVDPQLLEAPATQVRTQLKKLLLDNKWRDLLELGETVMGTPQGRGWFDLQRYVVTACEELGKEYQPVANAMRTELRTLLTDFPQLLEMTLMDDTPTANVETRAWLRAAVLTFESRGGSAASESADAERAPDEEGSPMANGSEDRAPRLYDAGGSARAVMLEAQAAHRAGRTDRAIALLMREAAREKTKRGRFLCQTQLASIMVESGHEAVALPILDELLGSVEAHKLEDWEEGELVAQPMSLLYRVLQATDGDAERRQSLYLRICRLDPLQAMRFGQS